MIFQLWERVKKQSLLLTSSHKRTTIRRYVVPLFFVTLVIITKLFLKTYVSEHTAYHLLTIIIILSAWYGGVGPGLFATGLTAILDTVLFLPPGESFLGLYNILSTIILIFGGVIVSFISEARRQADVQKDEFLGFASHELKNPLATILGYAQILKKQSYPTRQVARIANIIEEQSKRASMLINELLDVTKIETGKLSFHLEKFRLYDVVRATVLDQRVIYATHTIDLKGKTLKRVHADKYRIQQVLINYITNAIKYSPQAKKIIVQIAKSKNKVVVSVQDFGKGIAKENIDKVFDPYFREQSGSHGKIQGLGLGLYISSEIAKYHKGRLWVESKEGKGSTFYLELPAI